MIMTGRGSGWTVCVASAAPSWMGFCSLHEWPCVYDPLRTPALHIWGYRFVVSNIEMKERESENKEAEDKLIIVVGHSQVGIAGDTNCSGTPNSLLPSGFPSLRPTTAETRPENQKDGDFLDICCLMPTCQHCPITYQEAKQIAWPFAPACRIITDFPFYPAMQTSVAADLWVKFDPSILLCLASHLPDKGREGLENRIGHLPTSLVSSLVRPNRQEIGEDEEKVWEKKPSNRFPFVKSVVCCCAEFTSRQSYTFGLVRRHFSQSHRKPSSPLFPLLVFLLSLILVSLLSLTATFHFIPPPSASEFNNVQCQCITRTLRELIQLHNETAVTETSKFCSYQPSTFWWSNRVATCSPSGPYQESATRILHAFSGVAFNGFRNGCFFDVLHCCTEYFASALYRLLTWLGSGEPAGLKINRHLSLLMSRFFLSHIGAWEMYVAVLIQFVADTVMRIYALGCLLHATFSFTSVMLQTTILLISTSLFEESCRRQRQNGCGDQQRSTRSCLEALIACFSACSRLTICLIVCIHLDLLVTASLHLSCFYIYTVRLFRIQLLLVSASWRLCRSGSKWNPLRGRVDTIAENDELPPVVAGAVLVPINASVDEEDVTKTELGIGSPSRHLDRVFVATFLGVAIGLCLLPTTFAFYATFSMINVAILCVKTLLTGIVRLIVSFPVGAVFTWFSGSVSSRSNLVAIAPTLDSVTLPFLSLELVHEDLYLVIKKNVLFETHEMFGPTISFSEVLHKLFFAKVL